MAEFISFLEANALPDLLKANEQLTKMVANVDSVGQKMKAIQTPSGSDGALKQLTAEYEKQAKVITELQLQITKLANEKQRSNRQTQEEITNQAVLRQNSTRQAQATSVLAGAYANLSAQVAIASKRYQDLIVSGARAGQTQREYNRELKNAQREFQTLQTRVLQADKAVDKWNRTGERSIGFAKNLLGAFGIIGGVTLFAAITRDIFNTTKELQSLDNALKQVTETQDNFANQQSFLARISEDYGVEIKGLTKQFTQFYVSAKDKLSGQQIQNIFESITKAGAVMGLSVDSQTRAFLALNQMMSKGTIQAEELRGQLGEALPGAFGIMAKAVGVTEKELAKMMKDGKLLADEVLPKFAEQLEKTYGIETIERVETLASSQNRLANSWTELVRSLNDSETGGITAFFKLMIDGLTDVINLTKKLNDINAPKSQKTFNTGVIDGQKEALRQLNEQKKAGIATDAQIEKDAKSKIEYAKKQMSDIQWEINALEQKAKLEEKIRGKNVTALAMKLGFSGTATKEQIEAAIALEETNKEIVKLSRSYGFYSGIVKGSTEFLEKENKAEKTNTEEKKKNTKATTDNAKAKEKNAKIFTEDWFKQEISRLQKQRNAVADTTQEYSDFTTQIQVLEMLLDRLQGKEAPELGLKEEQIKILEDGIKKMQDFEEATASTGETVKKVMSSYEKSFLDAFGASAGLSETFKMLNGDIEGFGENARTTALAMTESFQEAFNFISQFSKKNREEERLAIQQDAEIAIAFAGGEQTAIDEINRQKEEKLKESRRKEFKAKKEMAKINIAIDTAQAIMATYGQAGFFGGLAGAIALAVIGAAQIALVNSQEIPEFWQGGITEGGVIKMNDDPKGVKGSNYKEVAVTPQGKIFKPQGKNVYADLPKGTEIFKNYDAFESSKFNQSLVSVMNNSGIQMSEQKQQVVIFDTQKIVDAIESKSEYQPIIDKNGFDQYVKRGNTVYQTLNKQVSFTRSSK